MLFNRITIPMMMILLGLSFAFHPLSKYFDFVLPEISWICFFTALFIGSLLCCFELYSQIKLHYNSKISDPYKESESLKNQIQEEREKIQEFLNFNPKGRNPQKIQEHYDLLKAQDFLPQAMAPFAAKWFHHVQELNGLIQRDLNDKQLELLSEQQEELEQEIKQLEHERDMLLQDEDESLEQEKKEFLAEYENTLHIDAKTISEAEKEWLEEAGFKQTHQWCIEDRTTKTFLVKCRSNESESHAYLTSAIAEHLENEDVGVELFETRLPDIVFNIEGKKWAIEVETGTVIQKSKKQLMEKVKLLQERYGDNWFFVVTNKNLLPKYRKYGVATDRAGVLKKLQKLIT